MEPFIVTLDSTNGIAKEPHPLKYPEKPQPTTKDYPSLLVEWETKLAEWNVINKDLKRYTIENLVCDSGIKIAAEHINFSTGEQRNAILLDNGKVEIYSLKKK